MLVEINLLPQKDRGKKGLMIIISSIAVIFLMISGYYFWQIQTTKSKITNIDNQITMTQKIADAEETNAQQGESSMSVTILKNAVEWANNYPIQTVPVMQHLTGLLPVRGFIQTFGYTEAGTVTLSVQFDSSREAAYFLDNLNESDWIEEASLSSLTTKELLEDKETATNTNNTGETGDGQTTTNPSILVTPDPNNPGSFIFTPVNPNENGTTSTDTQQKVTVPNNKYVPRYTGQFEIKFNKETIKKLLNNGDGNKEGVTAS